MALKIYELRWGFASSQVSLNKSGRSIIFNDYIESHFDVTVSLRACIVTWTWGSWFDFSLLPYFVHFVCRSSKHYHWLNYARIMSLNFCTLVFLKPYLWSTYQLVTDCSQRRIISLVRCLLFPFILATPLSKQRCRSCFFFFFLFFFFFDPLCSLGPKAYVERRLCKCTYVCLLCPCFI